MVCGRLTTVVWLCWLWGDVKFWKSLTFSPSSDAMSSISAAKVCSCLQHHSWKRGHAWAGRSEAHPNTMSVGCREQVDWRWRGRDKPPGPKANMAPLLNKPTWVKVVLQLQSSVLHHSLVSCPQMSSLSVFLSSSWKVPGGASWKRGNSFGRCTSFNQLGKLLCV